jgi:hypothetical protein
LSPTDILIHAAGRWFLHSGIQEPSGGVARYYRSDTGENARVSTEITGYAVSTFLFLHQRTGQSDYLDAALRAARFLTRIAWDASLGTFPFELSVNGERPVTLAYFFDCGIIVRGLLAAWRASQETEFRDAAVATGRGMLADFRAGDVIHPILVLPDKRPQPYDQRWSARPGCYQLKSALAWQELFETTGETQFQRGYESALEAALAGEQDFLEDEPDREKVMDRLHAYEYFLEGLLPALRRPECARVFQRGIERVEARLQEIAPVFARSDVHSQLLRARLYGECIGGISLDHTAAAQAAKQSAAFQITSADLRLEGGFLFGNKGGHAMPFVNPVSTAFGLQALTLWEDRKRGALEAPPYALI